MSFDKELQDIFGIDVWLVKPHFKKTDEEKIDSEQLIKIEEPQVENVKTGAVDDSNDIETKLIYSNDNQSSKIINIFISEDHNLNFVKNICEKLFYKSCANIYIGQHSCENNINIDFKDCLLKDNDVLSTSNKEYILSKLYQYADFTTK